MSNEKSLQSLKGEDTKRCPSCGSLNIVRRDDELFCEACGYVIED